MFRILFIDDDPTTLEGLTAIIQDYFPGQFQCSTANDGMAAIELLQKAFYHLIILDNKMPRLSGLSLLQIIHENRVPSCVVLLSGFDDYTYIRNALKAGARDYLLKPVNIKELVALVRSLIPELKDSAALLPPSSISSFLQDDKPVMPYFDSEPSPPFLTLDELNDQLNSLRQHVLNLDMAAVYEQVETIFSHVSPQQISQTEFQEELVSFVYSLIRHNSKIIQVIVQYKLTDHDILSHIKNMPHSSQLKEHFQSDLHLYMTEIAKIKKDDEQYIVRKAKAYIQEHYSGPLTLTEIASQFNLHPNYFSFLFKNLSGISVRDHILGVRIEQAKKLLADSDRKILDIAWEVGYQDAAHFNRAFKKITGMTPSQYRSLSDGPSSSPEHGQP